MLKIKLIFSWPPSHYSNVETGEDHPKFLWLAWSITTWLAWRIEGFDLLESWRLRLETCLGLALTSDTFIWTFQRVIHCKLLVDRDWVHDVTAMCFCWKSIIVMSQCVRSLTVHIVPPGLPLAYYRAAHLKWDRRECVMTQDATASTPWGDIVWM